jgi:hypothetical protein
VDDGTVQRRHDVEQLASTAPEHLEHALDDAIEHRERTVVEHLDLDLPDVAASGRGRNTHDCALPCARRAASTSVCSWRSTTRRQWSAGSRGAIGRADLGDDLRHERRHGHLQLLGYEGRTSCLMISTLEIGLSGSASDLRVEPSLSGVMAAAVGVVLVADATSTCRWKADLVTGSARRALRAR